MRSDPWLAPDPEKLPDFIIAGAMKCGTSTIHSILGRHPDVFIPDPEVFFFDVDDINQHGGFSSFNGRKWVRPLMTTGERDRYWDWYYSFFRDAPSGVLLGEDSTTYLASRLALKRIAMQEKPIKIIIFLRNPVTRTYSHYWHLYRSGLAFFDFEDTLRHLPATLLQRSLYVEQLRTLFDFIPAERVMIITLEKFLNERQNTTCRLMEFLGLDVGRFPAEFTETHANRLMLPRSDRVSRMINWIFATQRPSDRYKNMPQFKFGENPPNKMIRENILRVHATINSLNVRKAKKMHPATHDHLTEYFKEQMRGIDSLAGPGVYHEWFGEPDPGM